MEQLHGNEDAHTAGNNDGQNIAGTAAGDGYPDAGEGRRGENLWRNLARNLACGVRMGFLRRVSPDDLRAGPGDLAILAVADLVCNLVVSFVLVGRRGEFASPALPGFFFHLPLMLLVGTVAGNRLRRPGLATLVPVALVALSLPLELCHGVLEGAAQLPRLGWLADHLDSAGYYRFFWWWTAAAALFMVRLVPAAPRRRASVLLFFFLLLAVPLRVFPRGDLWLNGAGNSEGGELHLTGEVLATQARLLDERLAGLRPGLKGVIDLYFVGFAGDATQDVFAREVASIGRLFDERFGTAGRSVILANNPRTAKSLPFANPANLERSLAQVGRVMNRDEDVLFLYLTSHGSKEHLLGVENPPLEPEDFSPARLKRMLDKAGIRWRVIAVSACFAGGFIDPLKDDHTLIMTAADAGHESFGCSYGEEFTWFGRAYFDEALRSTRSFTDAFGKARDTIGQWEKRDGETPSNPQIWVGPAMARQLERLEAQ